MGILELYCGIGGAAVAFRDIAQVALAVDIDRTALAVYQKNFPAHTTRVAELESFLIPRLRQDLWWLSPPCLPYSRRGWQQDFQDTRSRSLMSIMNQIPEQNPRAIVIENVPPFAESESGQHIQRCLSDAGYDVSIELRCPTELGWPMRRQRCYLLASRDGLRSLAPIVIEQQSLRSFLDADPDETLAVPLSLLKRYCDAVDIVNEADDHAVAACFGSSYGKSPVRSGSYLRQADGLVRYFSPHEILRLMGFPCEFSFIDNLSRRRAWALVGNSVSVPVVRWVISRII